MSPSLPRGNAWPVDERTFNAHAEVEAHRPLSIYVHVPFCRIRCGYCDFNTYITGFGPGAEPGSYASSIRAETQLARGVLTRAGFPHRPASTVFFGGGTPTLLDTQELGMILEDLRATIGIAPGAEITIEANPDTVTAESLADLAQQGFTRVSFGMQSAVPHVLATLDRTHDPKQVPQVVRSARSVGLDVSVDLIYGTPGESLDDWTRTLEAALELDVTHISAYSLVIEQGTKMWAQLTRGEIPAPDADDEAVKYDTADRLLSQAGYRWYEISNFALEEAGEHHLVSTELTHASKHNLAYWRDWDWWGFGPGAHSHIGQMRWWNVKHPGAYAAQLASGKWLAAGGEILSVEERELERIMLGIRTAEGLDISTVSRPHTLTELRRNQLIDPRAEQRGRIVLTRRGRLLADHVTRLLTE